jgi:hypothetical protein
MSTQPEAIQWADAPRRVEFGCDMMQGLVGLGKDHTLTLYAEKEALHLVGPAMAAVVDAELRRLHAECNDLAHQLKESNERNGRLIAQRDALLEALKELMEYAGIIEERCDAVATNKARAAIKQAQHLIM